MPGVRFGVALCVVGLAAGAPLVAATAPVEFGAESVTAQQDGKARLPVAFEGDARNATLRLTDGAVDLTVHVTDADGDGNATAVIDLGNIAVDTENAVFAVGDDTVAVNGSAPDELGVGEYQVRLSHGDRVTDRLTLSVTEGEEQVASPGFGAVIAVVGVLGAAVLARRR